MKRLLTFRSLGAFLVLCLAFPVSTQAQEASAAAESKEPFIIEHSCKIKWGHFDEFLDLYKKNHGPLLQDAKKAGDILEVSAVKPVRHASEDKRWGLRVRVVWRSADTYHAPFDTEPVLTPLFPDRETFFAAGEARVYLTDEMDPEKRRTGCVQNHAS